MTSKTKESAFLRFLYHTAVGRFLLKSLNNRTVSKLCGAFLDSRLSKPMINSFIRKNNIQINDYHCENFKCFNDFFSRKIKDGLRPVNNSSNAFISPCDGFLSVYRINNGTVLPIKQSHYSINSLLQNEELAKKYQDGICLVFRLCINHYHRYCYIDNGTKKENFFIPGKLHTVRPIALEKYPVFIRNCREYTVMETENFGTVTQIEVGALLVGKIKNFHGKSAFKKGQEKGTFLYGGSTIVLLVEKDKVKFPQEYFDKTNQGLEIPVIMGEKIGCAVVTDLLKN